MSETLPDNQYVCPNPKCGSTSIQRCAMVFQSGTSRSTGFTSGVGVATGGGLGVFGASTETASSTLLAEQLAPPAKRGVGLWAFMIIIGVGMLISKVWWLVLLGLALIIIAVFFSRKIGKWNKTEYPKLLSDWEHSWVCHKCGHVFQLP